MSSDLRNPRLKHMYTLYTNKHLTMLFHYSETKHYHIFWNMFTNYYIISLFLKCLRFCRRDIYIFWKTIRPSVRTLGINIDSKAYIKAVIALLPLWFASQLIFWVALNLAFQKDLRKFLIRTLTSVTTKLRRR